MRAQGMRVFTVIWLGQTVSLVGSAMSWFGFSLWAWQQTGSATTWAAIQFLAFAPGILLGPLTGVLGDRWNRKAILIWSDAVTALCTLAVLGLYSQGALQVWHLYVMASIAGLCSASQYPAYMATVTLLVPGEHYARAAGMASVSQSLQGILGPILGAALIGPIGLQGILAIDVATFLAALGTLAWVRFPAVPQAAEREAHPVGTGLRREIAYGFRYLLSRPSLRALMLVFVAGNFFQGLGSANLAPMLLARTGSDELLLGSVQSIGAIGGLLGGGLLIAWGGPRRRVLGMLLSWTLSNLSGLVLMGCGTAFATWALGSFCFALFIPLVDGLYEAVLQTKVVPAAQGRVFAAQRFVIQIPTLAGTLLAGPIADLWFEPALQTGGAWAGSVGLGLGTGPGTGMALLMILAGVAGAGCTLAGYGLPALRHLEALLPDHTGGVDAGGEASRGV